jgi:uncharacterized protein (TIGR02569 family)
VNAPPDGVVRAFGGDAASCVPLAGGQGHAWRAGGVVLKPRLHGEPLEWLAALPDVDGLRIARPVASVAGDLLVDGWYALLWLAGDHDERRHDDILAAGERFHAGLADVPAPPRGATAWDLADRAVWGGGEPPPEIADEVAALEPFSGAPPQAVHGDLAGNVLFADELGLPPAIIDVSPMWRPAAYATAIAVADLVAWSGMPIALAGRAEPALLARAALFRIGAAALLCADPARVAAERAAYEPLIRLSRK